MEIKFEGKYRSITSFSWKDIPAFVVITGPNGTGKSQLLTLIYNAITGAATPGMVVSITNATFAPSEVTFLRGEWYLQNTSQVNLSTIIQQAQNYYNQFQQTQSSQYDPNQAKTIKIFKQIQQKLNKPYSSISYDEFKQELPELLIEQESQLSQKVGEIFYNYRLSEIDLLVKGVDKDNITKSLGEKPWDVLREIIKEAKLPFSINDPSQKGVKDSFQLKLTHQILDEEVYFSDLSSGEKVLLSLVFFLYSSQEKNVFSKLLLLDEPDAHLHPTMSQQFLNVIKNVLVDKLGVRVIMTTHSPSTVILSPNDSIYEMSRTEPRIQKTSSKNHAVSLLTAGIVYVGEGTKYFLVEDIDDVSFYNYVYNQCIVDGFLDSDIPLVFIPASTKEKSGGKNQVQNWVKKLQDSGLINIVNGLIDADSNNTVSTGIYKIDRYSIENYLIDPILVYAALLDKEKNPKIKNVNLKLGEEYKLKLLPNEVLQEIADNIIDIVEPSLSKYFDNYNPSTENQRVKVKFTNGTILLYPRWIIDRKGKTILNNIYNVIFNSHVNFTSQFKVLKKLNLFPEDLVKKFAEIKTH